MKKQIRLNDIVTNRLDNNVIVTYKLVVDEVPFDLTYSISIKGAHKDETTIDYVPHLCDPVVVSLMYNMLVEGYDFVSDIPISAKLYHNLTKKFIPHIVGMNQGKVSPVKIDAPFDTAPFERKEEWIGTGVSCGIDSFSAIKEYSEESSNKYRLTHLLYFKIGAHHGRMYPCPKEVEDRIFHDELEIANRFCEQNNFKLVVVDSNVNQMANKFWGAMPFGNVAWFRNVGVMLMMQAYFSKYIYATSYATFTDFSMDFSDGLEHNLWWSMPLLGSDHLDIEEAGYAMTRIEKTAFIADFKPAFDNLMVCWAGHRNCGECDKCIRTLVALDFLGVLDRFKNSFDLKKYADNKQRYLQHIVTYAARDAYFRELCEYAKANNIPMPNKIISVVNEYWRLTKQNNITSLPKLAYRRIRALIKG